MPEPLASVLKSLSHKIMELNEMDTAINRHIAAIEHSLAQFLSIRVELPLQNGPTIGFGKHNGAWRLLYNGLPLSDQSRGDRADAFLENWIERLIEALPKLLDAQYGEREAAILKARSIQLSLDLAVEDYPKKA